MSDDSFGHELLRLAKELPANLPFRKHLLEHIDLVAVKVVRVDPDCKYCDIHRQYANRSLQKS